MSPSKHKRHDHTTKRKYDHSPAVDPPNTFQQVDHTVSNPTFHTIGTSNSNINLFTYGNTASLNQQANAIASLALPPVATCDQNIYSFSTVFEKATVQQPNEIHVALDAHRDVQRVANTSFRMDNILPSTRYNELPEQAKMELDELNQYIHGESQKSDYLLKEATFILQQTMKEIQHEQDMVHYKVNALSNILDRQVNAASGLFDSLQQQMNDYSNAQSVIKLRGAGSAWQQYGACDDYFPNLAARLNSQLEEFKGCVDDIGLTTSSLIKNQMTSPQDISRLLACQNNTFLALTNQVVNLHERLVKEIEIYTQHR